MAIFSFVVPSPETITKVEERTKVAVTKIRACGGEAVFVRPLSIDPLRALEEKQLPRARGWEPLLQAAQTRGVHFEDLPDAQGLLLPENSHLNRACAVVFTDAYVRALAQVTGRLVVTSDAPPALPINYRLPPPL